MGLLCTIGWSDLTGTLSTPALANHSTMPCQIWDAFLPVLGLAQDIPSSIKCWLRPRILQGLQDDM